MDCARIYYLRTASPGYIAAVNGGGAVRLFWTGADVCGREPGGWLRLSSAPSAMQNTNGRKRHHGMSRRCVSIAREDRGADDGRRVTECRGENQICAEGCVCGVEYEMIGDAGRFRT